MQFAPTDIPGVILIAPDVHRDPRGYFLETYHAEKYRRGGLPTRFVQDNQSCSVRNTLRGLHLQLRKPQAKLVRVIEGEIWDVAVDVRPGSPTFGCWTAAYLSAENFKQLYVPERCAHGFCVVSERAQVEYKCSALYDPTDEVGIAYDDPTLNIPWPVSAPILSDRDRRNLSLSDMMERLPAKQAFRRQKASRVAVGASRRGRMAQNVTS
jgi:dTDP-4-dehydrorhamnose 3,5-epimerase